MNNIGDLFVLPRCATKTFADIFPNYTTFKDLYDATAFAGSITDANLEVLYYLLYAKYGNNNITNLDETQWVYKVFATVYKYGPTWEKKIQLQANLRGLTSTQLEQGAKAIYNHAYNPGSAPSTDILNYINDQNTTNQIKSPTDAIKQLYILLEADVTEEFLIQFKPLFKKFISPYTRLYESED